MSKPYIERRYVTLSEEREYTLSGDHFVEWTATVHGRVTGAGETLEMSRTAPHAGEALLRLTEALAAEGYELR